MEAGKIGRREQTAVNRADLLPCAHFSSMPFLRPENHGGLASAAKAPGKAQRDSKRMVTVGRFILFISCT